MTDTLLWHDYETFGIDPARDRPAQFAAIRTDEELNEIGEPIELFCKPPNDYLPQPDACLITGITPQRALERGLPESEFIARVNAEMSVPHTCSVGYNSLRFDDEVTRNALYRNFLDPYAREWQGGNSRWDIIDLLRAARALRPEGIEWPVHEDGSPSLRLEHLTVANGIGHEAAHDAVSDVRATIAVARLVRKAQPRLYDYLFKLRRKQEVTALLDVAHRTPVVHVSGMYPGDTLACSVVMPLAWHPVNNNGVLVYDLRQDPEPFFDLDVEALRERLFTSREQLGDDNPRLPVKTIHVNKCPVVAPLKTLDEAARIRTNLDMEAITRHHQRLLTVPGFDKRVREAFAGDHFEKPSDPDLMIYAGGFFSDNDKRLMMRIRELGPAELAGAKFNFEDRRLPEMLFRYRARNWPESLSDDEQAVWQEHREYRLMESGPGVSQTIDDYFERIEALRVERPDRSELLAALEDYGHRLTAL
ncbi:MAG: exodeoxyribonuclease I [Gammaproteobacteria bacterium]|nr:exodeoxyribonuclease I [Gammaproteobacteria bacterium]MCP5135716.1 exodeoxyribonuclease I [Gammaproteobacteria bacterium]